MKILGVDPGGRGALALLSPQGLEVEDMPVLMVRRGKTDKPTLDVHELVFRLEMWMPDVCYFEQVGGMQGDSPSSSFNFGRMAGAAEAIVRTCGGRFHFAPPTTWKRRMGLVNAGKDGARALAMDLFPKNAADFRLRKHDGRAEAALLAEYGRRREAAAISAEEVLD